MYILYLFYFIRRAESGPGRTRRIFADGRRTCRVLIKGIRLGGISLPLVSLWYGGDHTVPHCECTGLNGGVAGSNDEKEEYIAGWRGNARIGCVCAL